MHATVSLLLRAVAIGAATGSRATIGLGSLALRNRRGNSPGSATVRTVAVVAIVGELVWDQLPGCPSRLEWPGLIARVGGASLSGALLASRPRDRVLLAATATVLAVVAAVSASRWRRRWAQRGRPSWLGGTIEDIVALAVAAGATRASPGWVVKQSSG